MPTFTLTADQLGALADDGSIIRHPERDITGAPADRLNGARKPLTHNGEPLTHNGARVFVVIPVGKDHEDNVYILPETPKKGSKE